MTQLMQGQHSYNNWYRGENTSRIAFPIGGIGAGMFCLEGTGAVSHMSIRHEPDMYNEPLLFAAISVKQIPNSARVLEGPVPAWKKFGLPGTAGGAGGTSYGLARFREASFLARFPFGKIQLRDNALPLGVSITGWSPFIPTDADNSSLPVGALEYHFKNTGVRTLEYVFSYNARNFLTGEGRSVKALKGGYLLSQYGNAQKQSAFAIYTDEPGVSIDHCWFRGGWWDALSMAWNKIENNDVNSVAPVEKDAPGASLYVPFTLKPGEEKTIRVLMAWYVPESDLRTGVPVSKPSDIAVRDASNDLPSPNYKPWYSSRFKSIGEVADYWRARYDSLRYKSQLFSDAFYKTSLPAEVTEAIAANLTILKSPTAMRQYDGRFWGWEGCDDTRGSCAGSCTHVYNYQQAIAHLFPSLERSIRETEYNESMDVYGHQNYRAALPVRPAGHNYYLPAADGQLGSIMRAYRDWRISGDEAWLKQLFPKLKLSMNYCIDIWDPLHKGVLEKLHHNTYDIEFSGPEPMCTSIYLGALEAMIAIGKRFGENVDEYEELLAKGRSFVESNLFNGEYFFQQTDMHQQVEAEQPYSSEALALIHKEGPNYQYGAGCLSDGVIGAWEAQLFGLPVPLSTDKVKSHLQAVYNYNFKKDLAGFSNPQRPGFALGNEGGLLLCTWPRGGKLSLPFVYSNEVWTGVEYEVASHLMMMGKVQEGLNIVRTTRNRYDGRVRNPFDEYEAGHWYIRALSSYALIEACTGVRYDAVDRTLYIDSKVGDFVSFLSTDTGFGNVVYKNGKATVNVVYGKIDIQKIIAKR